MNTYHSLWIDRNQYLRPKPGTLPGDHHYQMRDRAVIVCLCGSTKFMQQFYDANMMLTLLGKIVLSVGMSSKGDCKPTDEQKLALDALHFEKIDLADEILVLNVGGYVGDSTRREVLHAHKGCKTIRWLEPDRIPPDLAHTKGNTDEPPFSLAPQGEPRPA